MVKFSIYLNRCVFVMRQLSPVRVRLEIRRSRVRSHPDPASFFCGDWSWIIFCGYSILPLSLFQKKKLSVSGGKKNADKYLLTAKRTKLPQEKCMQVKWQARHNRNIVDRAVKLPTNQPILKVSQFLLKYASLKYFTYTKYSNLSCSLISRVSNLCHFVSTF